MGDAVRPARSTSSTSAAGRIASRRSSRTISPAKADAAARGGRGRRGVPGGLRRLPAARPLLPRPRRGRAARDRAAAAARRSPGERRMIGDVLLDCDWAGPARSRASRTTRAARCSTRARSRSAASSPGSGTTATSGFEGCRDGRVVRDVPARAAAAAQPVVRGPAARRGARARDGRRARARAARGRARARGARGLAARRASRRPLRNACAVARRGRFSAPRASRGRPPGRPAASAHEALHRRMEHDLLELVEREEPRARGRPRRSTRRPRASGARGRRRRRCGRRGGAGRHSGAIDSATAIGPSNGEVVRDARAPRRARGAAPRSSVSPPSTPPPGSSQYSLPGFSCRQRSTRSCQRRSADDTDARLHQCARRSRSRARRAPSRRQLVDLDELDVGQPAGSRAGRSASRARRRTSRARSVLSEVDQQLAAVARVDEPGRVDDRDPVLGREARSAAGRSPRSPPGSRRRGPVGTSARSPGRELDALARGEVEAGVARVGPRRAAPPRRAGAGSAARSGGSRRFGASLGDRYGAKRRSSRRGRRATTSTPSGVSSRSLDRRAERVELRRAGRPRRTGASRRTRSQRLANCSAIRACSSSRPSPVARGDLRRVRGSGCASRRRPSSSTRSILFRTSCDGKLARADLVQHLARPPRPSRRAASSRADASATCRTMSATSVSSSVAAKPSTSWCGRRRMKPTVSVTR